MKKLVVLMSLVITMMTSCFKLPSNSMIAQYLEQNKDQDKECILLSELAKADSIFLSFRKNIEKSPINNNGVLDLRNLDLLETFKIDSLLINKEYVLNVALNGYTSILIKNINPEDRYKFIETDGDYLVYKEIIFIFVDENNDDQQKLLIIQLLLLDNKKIDLIIDKKTGLIILFYKESKFLDKFGFSKDFMYINHEVKKIGKEYVTKEAERTASEVLDLLEKIKI